jgi:hypothetical protein
VWSTNTADPHARWLYFMIRPNGLAWLKNFAAQHNKPFGIAEWAITSRKDGHGAGDDPYFVEHMAAWLKSSNALYQDWFEMKHDEPGQLNYDDTLSYGTHPLATAAYKRAFGGGQ